jgi:hypothetical protein
MGGAAPSISLSPATLGSRQPIRNRLPSDANMDYKVKSQDSSTEYNPPGSASPYLQRIPVYNNLTVKKAKKGEMDQVTLFD